MHYVSGIFNPYAVRDEEWIVVGYKKAHPKLGFRELAYAMIDEYIAYLSPSTVYNIQKKHDLIAERKVRHRDPVRIGWPPDRMRNGSPISCISGFTGDSSIFVSSRMNIPDT